MTVATPVVLVLNSGSSSVKYTLFQRDDLQVVMRGAINNIALDTAIDKIDINQTGLDQALQPSASELTSHQQAFDVIINQISQLVAQSDDIELCLIAHRVVHGAKLFTDPVMIDHDVINKIFSYQHLAPQHLPGNLAGLNVCINAYGALPQVAVFDTAFHQTLPEHVHRYAIPSRWYEEFGIRKYGFHGSSHKYVAEQAAEHMNTDLTDLNLISFHLGNGASACAIKAGESIDTSMGFTPLEGLMMGNRSGDLDAAIPLYIQEQTDLSAEQLEHQLNFESGLIAIADTNDMQTIQKRYDTGDEQAILAVKMYVHHIRRYLGAYMIMLGHVDAVIFTGGIGENSALIRELSSEHLERYGIQLNSAKNQSVIDEITSINDADSHTKVLVIKTDEEKQIAIDAINLVNEQG